MIFEVRFIHIRRLTGFLQVFIIAVAVSPGTTIRFYGVLRKGGGLVLQLDENITTVLLNRTMNGLAPAFHAENLEDGDHQLYGKVESLQDSGIIIVDHFESVTPYSIQFQE